MKFSALKNLSEKHLRIDTLDGGLDTSVPPTNIENSSLSDCKNVFFDGHKLKTRPALFTDTSKIIKCDYTEESFYSKFELTESKIYFENDCYRVAVEYIQVDIAEQFAAIYFVNSEGTPSYKGAIRFWRTSDEIFYVPYHITVYQGKPQTGGGIFALVCMTNAEKYTEKRFEIYEIDSANKSWQQVKDFYTPTVYINGRGDSYERAAATDQAYSAAPINLEVPNMLNGEFYAYFSSDGYSSAFRLPFSGLAQKTVICRVYTNPTSYTEWIINSENSSDVQSILGSSVTLNVDRSKGMIYFTVPSGDYSIPLMGKYRANNIKITATKTIESGFDDIVSCTKCAYFNSRIVLSGGIKNNRVYSARYENPLYFPLSDATEIGEPISSVTALLPFKDKILAFKSGESYLIDIKRGKAINSIALLADNNSIFYKSDTFSVTPLNHNAGALSENAVTILGDNAMFYANDGNIYLINRNGSIKNMGNKIKALIKKISRYSQQKVIVLSSDSYFIFAWENIAFAYWLKDNEINNGSWYFWEFPEDISVCGGFSGVKSPVLLYRKGVNTAYCATLSGDTDIIIEDANSEKIAHHNINSFFETKHFLSSSLNSYKKLNKIYMNLYEKGKLKILINGKNARIDFNSNYNYENQKCALIIPWTSRLNSVYITLFSDTYFELGELDVFFKEASE